MGSPNPADSVTVDFGIARRPHELRLHYLEDAPTIIPPQTVNIDYWDGANWQPLEEAGRTPVDPTGRRANPIRLQPRLVRQLRVTFAHAAGAAAGLTELEVWGEPGDGNLAAPAREPNLATNTSGEGYPQVTASHTSRYDEVSRANDGIVSFHATPNNRWTAFESPAGTDWLELDFGKLQTVGRIALHIYDDHGGVQTPAKVELQYDREGTWQTIPKVVHSPPTLIGNSMNTLRFQPISTRRVRVVFHHSGAARSGVTELEAWPD